ncbi:MFS transporter [Labedella endophytica]|uniref:MFS transporter n=1 Tax=Labedella endophytica TaxID=1523160 RepID=A0A433JV62_9MICO|nr:MFS transporter [Labedella endophytica]RUR03042.1 MFS transporter [Labedella endophytica]
MSGYRDALGAPGALRVFLPALLGRLSLAMVTLVLLYAVQEATDSFAIAGAATGAFGLANVIASPFRARLVDRHGQRLTLSSLSVLYAAGLIGVAVATAADGTPAAVVIGLAAIAGVFPPPLGASMRVIWGSLTPAGPARTAAYSLDAVSEELLFTGGPLLAAAIITLTDPPTALVATAALSVVGTLGMTSSAASRSRLPSATTPPRAARPLSQPGFALVLLALLGVGVVLGTVEVAAPAVAEAQGSVGIAGLLLAAFAGGSAIGGLLYGRRPWRSSLVCRLLVCGATMIALSALMAALPGVAALAAGLALVGFFLAPSLITGYLLADDLTDVEVRTEASSWINTAVNAGAAVAAIAVGAAADATDPRWGFLVGAAGAGLLLAVAAPGLLRHRRRPRSAPAPTPPAASLPVSVPPPPPAPPNP